MSRSADVTSGVQKKYLAVKSADFNLNLRNEDYPYLDVEFPEPLQHVHEIALQTATIPNEFFNVREGQNDLTIAWTSFDHSLSRAFTLTVPPGLYTLDKLCDALNVQTLAAATAGELRWNPDAADLSDGIEFSRQASAFATNYMVTQITNVHQETNIPNGSQEGQTYYALVHVATPQAPFETSIAARLGFTRHDVFIVHESPQVTPGNPAIEFDNANITTWDNAPANFNYRELSLMEARGNTSVFQTNLQFADGVNDTSAFITTTSMLSGSETYSNILLHCDLLSNSTLVTSHVETSNHSITTIERSDVLAVIPNNANIGSSIVYIRPSEHYNGHAVNQHRPITKMRLWLTDPAGKPFKQYEMPDYVAVLEFTVVEQVPDIMRQVAQLNQNKAFQSRHMPMTLG